MANIRVNFTCTVEGCALPAHSKGVCRMHYKRIVKHGDPHTVIISTRRPADPAASRGPSCPACRETSSFVKDSRQSEDESGNIYVRRRRKCGHCNHRWTTFEHSERITQLPPAIVRSLRTIRADLNILLNLPAMADPHD